MIRILRWWESRPTGVQAAVALPVCMAVMLGLHLGPLRQPFWRGLSYAVFWGVLAAALIIVATKAEAAKRRQAETDRRRRRESR